MNICAKLLIGTTATAFYTPLIAAGSALVGYVYAKLADLPAGQVAKAWAIWGVAETAITCLSTVLVMESKSCVALLKVTIVTAGGIIGIQELRKRGLMGDKMMIVIIAFRALTILNLLGQVGKD